MADKSYYQILEYKLEAHKYALNKKILVYAVQRG